MTNSGYFLYLAEGAAEWMARFFPITFMLATILCAGVAIGWTASGSRRAGASSACIIPLLIPVCILVIGVAFVRPEYTAWREGTRPPIPWFTAGSSQLPQIAITILLALHLPLCLGLCWRAGRGWPAAVAASLWWGWVSFCSAVMATMSVTGNWL